MDTKIPMERQISQTLRNLIIEGRLGNYTAELQIIIANIYHHNCGIICENLAPSSWISQTPHNNTNRPLIHIGLFARNKPLDIIWSILHEFGHVLQDAEDLIIAKVDTDFEYVREMDACK